MKRKGCIPEGNTLRGLRGPVLKGHISERVQSVPPALEAPPRGLGKPPSLAQVKIPCRLPAWMPLPEGKGEMGEKPPGQGCARGPAPGLLRRPGTALARTLRTAAGSRERQESVPGEMSLAPAGGRGGRGAALGCCRQR